jgi:AbiV family abortive infection protein
MDITVKAIIDNAQRLLEDAILLAADGSYRTAIALTVLSLEESGKASLVLWQKLGFLKVEASALRHHSEKQRIIVAYRAALTIYQFGDVVAFDEVKNSVELSDEQTHELMEKVQASAGLDRFTVDAGFNDYLKEHGFYTDISDQLEVLVPYATYNEDVFTLFSRRATESICFVQAAQGFQRTAAALYEGNVHPRLSRKETRDLQKSMFSTLDELYAAGGERPD